MWAGAGWVGIPCCYGAGAKCRHFRSISEASYFDFPVSLWVEIRKAVIFIVSLNICIYFFLRKSETVFHSEHSTTDLLGEKSGNIVARAGTVY